MVRGYFLDPLSSLNFRLDIPPCSQNNRHMNVVQIQQLIQKPAKYLRWSVLRKQLRAEVLYFF